MAHPILHWFSLRPVPDSSGGWPEPGKEMQSGGAGHGLRWPVRSEAAALELEQGISNLGPGHLARAERFCSLLGQ